VGYLSKISEIYNDLWLYVGMGTWVGCSQEGAAAWLAQDEGQGAGSVGVRCDVLHWVRFTAYYLFTFLRLCFFAWFHDDVVHVFPAAYLSMHANMTCILVKNILHLSLLILYSAFRPESHAPVAYQNAAPYAAGRLVSAPAKNLPSSNVPMAEEVEPPGFTYVILCPNSLKKATVLLSYPGMSSP